MRPGAERTSARVEATSPSPNTTLPVRRAASGRVPDRVADGVISSQPGRGTRTVLRRPEIVAAAAFALYLLFFLLHFNESRDLRDFILIGKNFVLKGQDRSPVIKVDPDYNYDKLRGGYDGQYAYFIALDPANARYYVDLDSYRYTRILYPMAARAMSLGNPDWVPLALVVVNWLAITGGTWAVAAWCAARRVSPWVALVYALYIGQFIAFNRDLNEPLAFALVAAAVLVFDLSPRLRYLSAGLFALAALGRETTLVFPALYALRIAVQGDIDVKGWVGRLPGAGLFAAIAAGPAVAWQFYLAAWLGTNGLRQGGGLLQPPFSGLYYLFPLGPETIEVVQAVVIPGLICLAVALYQTVRNPVARGRVEIWALVANAILFVVLLPLGSMREIYGSARVVTPVVLCAVYSLAFVPGGRWFAACAALWLAPTAAYLANPLLALLYPR